MHKLEVDSVILEFDSKRILQDVYLKVETGNAIGLLGRNGTGKSSLMKILFGELQIENMSVRYDNHAILGSYRDPSVLRFLPQFNFIPHSIKVKTIFKHYEVDYEDFIVFFPHFEKFYASRTQYLSSGERRVIETYIILISKTKFAILDDPFSHVMPLHIEVLKK